MAEPSSIAPSLTPVYVTITFSMHLGKPFRPKPRSCSWLLRVSFRKLFRWGGGGGGGGGGGISRVYQSKGAVKEVRWRFVETLISRGVWGILLQEKFDF